MEKYKYGMGWQRDLPDFRDYAPESDQIVQTLPPKSKALTPPRALVSECDLSQFCSPVDNQGSLGSCTANAGVGLLEYYENRAYGRFIDASRLFLYKTTRNLLHWTGDTGAWLRTTMKAMVLFGSPPEEYHPYDISRFEEEPSAFCYAFGQNYQAIKYFRLDQPGLTTSQLLSRIKKYLMVGYPSMFGFTVYNYGNNKGEFAFPAANDTVLGGHAVVAVGYDDNRKIGRHKGALKIRNSWGNSWGESGYGWLPYAYVEAGLAVDFWSLFKAEYVETNNFE